MSDLALQLFSAARERYQSAVRWQALAIAGLVGFHLTVMTPYVELSLEQAELGRQLDRERQVAGLMTELAEGAAQLKAASEDRARALAGRAKDELRAGFAGLSVAIAAIKDPSRAARPGSPAPLPDMPFVQMPLVSNLPALPSPGLQVQQVPAMNVQQFLPPQAPLAQMPLGAPPVAPFDPSRLDPALLRRIGESGSGPELLFALRPLVEKDIVAPVFASFRREWRDGPLVEIKSTAARLIERADRAARAEPAARAPADRLRAAAEALVAAAERLELQPGDNPYWWETVEGKGATLDASLSGLSDRVATLVRADREIDELSRQVATLLREKQALLEAASGRLKEIEAQFRQQQAKVASFAEPLQAISFDLAIIAPLYPLVLGLLVAALLAWPAARLLELRDAVAMLPSGDAGPIARAWLAARAGHEEKGADLLLIAIAVLSLGWLAVTVFQLWGFPGLARTRLIVLAVAGAAAVVAALVYRRYAYRGALALKRTD